MSKGDIWILIGLIILSFVISTLIPPFFAIFGIFFLLTGLYMLFTSKKTPNKDEIKENQNIPVENEEIKPNEAIPNPVSSVRTSETPVIEKKMEEEKEKETIEEETEEESPAAEMDEERGFEEEDTKDETEIFGEEINKKQSWENKTPGKDLAFIVAGILCLLIGALLSRVPFLPTIFSFLGFLSIGIGLYLVLKRILRSEQVVDNWSILIVKGNGRAEEVFRDTEDIIENSKVSSIRIKRTQMVPGIIRGIFGTKRDFLFVTDTGFRLKPYQVFINVRDYGENLDISWYLTYRLSFWRSLFSIIPGFGKGFSAESLDLFDRQDLTAYVTVCHHSTLEAIEKLMLALNQDPAKIDRKSKGFLGIS